MWMCPRDLGILDINIMAGVSCEETPRAAGTSVLSQLAQDHLGHWISNILATGTPSATPVHQYIKLIKILFCQWHLFIMYSQV